MFHLRCNIPVKLNTYGLSENALKLMESYLANKRQCVKLGNFNSNHQSILKCMPQGSILGPVLFNIFINDIFHFIKTVSCIIMHMMIRYHIRTKQLKRLIDELVEDSMRLIKWFVDNQMKANPGKCQAIALGNHTHSENTSFNLGHNIVKGEDSVKLLGVITDYKLDFDELISNVCNTLHVS